MRLGSLIKEIIDRKEDVEEETIAVIYADKIDGLFTENSEASLLNLNEEELEWKTNKVAKKYCPNYEYFLEVFLIVDMLEGIDKNSLEAEINARIKIIINYAENDA